MVKLELKPVIEKVSKDINDLSPPSPYTLSRWTKLIIKCGDDIRLLIPLYGKRGNRTRKFGYKRGPSADDKKQPVFNKKDREKAEEVASIIDTIISEEFLTKERLSVETICDSIEARITKLNKRRGKEDKLPTPAKSSVYEIVSKIPEYEKDASRYGKRYADIMHKTTKQGPRPKRPLERVEMDDTKLDLFVIDAERCMPIGRPTLFSAIDVKTKYPIGFDISFNAPGYLSVMNCLIHAINRKTYVRERYPEIENEWPCYGIMDQLVVDNAKHYWSESLEDAAVELNFLIEYSPIRAPWYKASVERFFGTVNRQLLHHQPGTTFSNIFDKKDYNPKKNAVISFQTLLKIIHIFIIDIYPREVHDFDGFEDVPARRWEEAIGDFPPVLPMKAKNLDVLIGQVEWRVISNNGVELFGLRYNCDEIATLRSELKGAKAKIKLNPNDLSIVHVADISNGRYIHVPAKNQEYTKGLTLYQHDVIRRHARQTAKDYVDIEALCRAKELIKKIVKEEWEKSRPSDTRVRQARFMNYGYQIQGEGVEHEASISKGVSTAPQDSKLANEQSRLYPYASGNTDSSDLGSAFPIFAMLDESGLGPRCQPVNGSIEQGTSAKNARAIKKSNKGRKPTNGLRQVEHKAEEDEKIPVVEHSNTNPDFDRSGWSAEYD